MSLGRSRSVYNNIYSHNIIRSYVRERRGKLWFRYRERIVYYNIVLTLNSRAAVWSRSRRGPIYGPLSYCGLPCGRCVIMPPTRSRRDQIVRGLFARRRRIARSITIGAVQLLDNRSEDVVNRDVLSAEAVGSVTPSTCKVYTHIINLYRYVVERTYKAVWGEGSYK